MGYSPLSHKRVGYDSVTKQQQNNVETAHTFIYKTTGTLANILLSLTSITHTLLDDLWICKFFFFFGLSEWLVES